MSKTLPGRPRARIMSLGLVMSLAFALFALRPEISFADSHEPQDKVQVIFLVRHAEKMTTGPDPDLTPAGQVRAQMLASLLKDASIRHVHSTDTTRTRDTANPVAAAAGLTVEIYDLSEMGTLAARMKGSGERHLVVGHSNTTTKMVELLGGDPGSPIDDNSEFDRLYVLSIAPGGAVGTVLLRF